MFPNSVDHFFHMNSSSAIEHALGISMTFTIFLFLQLRVCSDQTCRHRSRLIYALFMHRNDTSGHTEHTFFLQPKPPNTYAVCLDFLLVTRVPISNMHIWGRGTRTLFTNGRSNCYFSGKRITREIFTVARYRLKAKFSECVY